MFLLKHPGRLFEHQIIAVHTLIELNIEKMVMLL